MSTYPAITSPSTTDLRQLDLFLLYASTLYGDASQNSPKQNALYLTELIEEFGITNVWNRILNMGKIFSKVYSSFPIEVFVNSISLNYNDGNSSVIDDLLALNSCTTKTVNGLVLVDNIFRTPVIKNIRHLVYISHNTNLGITTNVDFRDISKWKNITNGGSSGVPSLDIADLVLLSSAVNNVNSTFGSRITVDASGVYKIDPTGRTAIGNNPFPTLPGTYGPTSTEEDEFTTFERIIANKGINEYVSALIPFQALIANGRFLSTLRSSYGSSGVNAVTIDSVTAFVGKQPDLVTNHLPLSYTSPSTPSPTSPSESTSYVLFQILYLLGYSATNLKANSTIDGLLTSAAVANDFDAVFGGVLHSAPLTERISKFGLSNTPDGTFLKSTDTAVAVANAIVLDTSGGVPFPTASGSGNEPLTVNANSISASSPSPFILISGGQIPRLEPYDLQYGRAMIQTVNLSGANTNPAAFGAPAYTWDSFFYPNAGMTVVDVSSTSVAIFAKYYYLDPSNSYALTSKVVDPLSASSAPLGPVSADNTYLVVRYLARDDPAILATYATGSAAASNNIEDATSSLYNLLNLKSQPVSGSDLDSILNLDPKPWSYNLPPAYLYLRNILLKNLDLTPFLNYASSNLTKARQAFYLLGFFLPGNATYGSLAYGLGFQDPGVAGGFPGNKYRDINNTKVSFYNIYNKPGSSKYTPLQSLFVSLIGPKGYNAPTAYNIMKVSNVSGTSSDQTAIQLLQTVMAGDDGENVKNYTSLVSAALDKNISVVTSVFGEIDYAPGSGLAPAAVYAIAGNPNASEIWFTALNDQAGVNLIASKGLATPDVLFSYSVSLIPINSSSGVLGGGTLTKQLVFSVHRVYKAFYSYPPQSAVGDQSIFDALRKVGYNMTPSDLTAALLLP
uniref:Uncharacterized protein n=1 Tax=viral metagenome TaxID=1070528 RepID=A0A6C0EPI8_9ZZZZ